MQQNQSEGELFYSGLRTAFYFTDLSGMLTKYFLIQIDKLAWYY